MTSVTTSEVTKLWINEQVKLFTLYRKELANDDNKELDRYYSGIIHGLQQTYSAIEQFEKL